MKNFINHRFHPIERIDSAADRLYQIPSGERYPSVTSVTGLSSQKYIKEWRDRVGEEKANQITTRASKRGTEIHALCEDYLKTGQAKPSMFDAEMFNTIRPHLDKINNIHCLETKLYSHHLQVAGTVDCIAEYDGKLHVIDFKTSSRVKDRESIHGYFAQTAAYAVMFEELTGVPVARLMIIMGVDDNEALVFHERRNDWISTFKQLRQQYKDIKGI